ncbi:hypothetical protein RRG08_041282 [Elysia crispata]|uniref:Uncharacterized protein n=1 Tax=Elysia crispata TaxID=231223 RepID=A0AAE1D0W7_9GAST|nr:hypothetical protein RRG08_041282 [Elysia crispata]
MNPLSRSMRMVRLAQHQVALQEAVCLWDEVLRLQETARSSTCNLQVQGEADADASLNKRKIILTRTLARTTYRHLANITWRSVKRYLMRILQKLSQNNLLVTLPSIIPLRQKVNKSYLTRHKTRRLSKQMILPIEQRVSQESGRQIQTNGEKT